MPVDVSDKNTPGFPEEKEFMSLDEATRLLKSDFGRSLNQTVMSFSSFVTFGFHDRLGNYHLQGSGTCIFLRTPKKLLVVTAAHVFGAMMNAKKENPQIIASIGSEMFDFENKLIATGKRGEPNDVDIATFGFTDAELKKHSGKAACEYWPPLPPTEGHGVAFGGYPAQEIVREKSGTRGFGFYTGVNMTKKVTDRQIEINLEHSDLSNALIEGKAPQPGYNTGGMSGGPIVTLAVHRKTGLMLFILGGVISEGKFDTDTLYAERADAIRADGSIRR